jgi:hypothetical protein
MAALAVIIVTGPMLAVVDPRLGLAARADFVVSAAVMLLAFRHARSCERAAVLALLRWILHASQLQGAFAPLPTLPIDGIPVVVALFFEPPLTAATLFFSASARWRVERSTRSAELRWKAGAPAPNKSLLSMFLVAMYMFFFAVSTATLFILHDASATPFIAIGIAKSIIVLAMLYFDSAGVVLLGIISLLVITAAVATLSSSNISEPLPVFAVNMSIVIYFVFSDYQRARIWRQVRT